MTHACADCGKAISRAGYRCRSCASRRSKVTHGLARVGARARIYSVWHAMKRRCTEPSDPSFENYGGRGITVCEEWMSDAGAFARHMGPKPTGQHTVERIDNDGDYEPGNVRWATRADQQRNQRRTKLDRHDIPFIRHWLSRGHSQASVARAFEVSQGLISMVRSHGVWGDV